MIEQTSSWIVQLTYSSKRRANVEQTWSNSTCILSTFVRRLLDVCSIV